MASITTSEAEMIVKLPKSEGRLKLLECLKWEPFEEEKDMRTSIHLDFLYDTLQFAAEKGFSWDKIKVAMAFSDKLLQQIQESDTITDVFGFYKSVSVDLIDIIGKREYKILTSFIFETLLPHFKLYKFVFTCERKEQIPNVPVLVEPPFDTKVLKETKPLKVWEYEQKIQELERKESEIMNQKLSEKEKKLSKLDQEKSVVLQKKTEVNKSLDKETVTSIIQDVMKQYTLAATENIRFEIERLQEDLEFKLEKTSLPRPQALGPPPRFSTQPAKTPASSKLSKSPKPGSRNSSKAKKK